LEVTQEKLHAALVERHGLDVQKKLDAAVIGIAGLGGLGSHIATYLTRMGVGRLVLVDFDTVDITNLHRQNYTITDIGLPKTTALKNELLKINPYLHYETRQMRVAEENAAALFSSCDIVCEAFDRPEQKAMLIETLLLRLPDTIIVSGNGMAGYGSANTIQTKQLFSRLYICGDGESDSARQGGLYASRVAVCAAHQANAVLRLIVKK